jgi:FlaA1/EpsC-like NDP-sugar epimerase
MRNFARSATWRWVQLVDNQQPSTIFDSLVLRVAAARVLILFSFHAIVFAGCYALAWMLRFDFQVPLEFRETFQWSLPVVVGVQLLIGLPFGFYRGWWRYVGIGDVVRLVFGLSTAFALLATAWYVGGTVGLPDRYFKSPRGVLLVDWAFSLLALFGARAAIRLGRDRFRPAETPTNTKRVLIIGAGDAGETLAREIEHRPQLGMNVVGFVDDQRAKWGAVIRGIKVTGPIADIATIADGTEADEALIAIPSASGKRLREIINHLSKADLKFKTIPGIDHLVTGRVHVTQLRPVNIEDLVRRTRIDLPGDPVRKMFKGKRVLITGAGGTIGGELASQLLQLGPEKLALVERSEYALYEVRKRLARDSGWASSQVSCNLVDIGDKDIVEDLLRRERPHIVLHAAAHKHVPLGEENPAEYVRNNTLATRLLAEICSHTGVERFVLISTDKAINPTSVMGATKRAAEIVLLDCVRTSSLKATIVRFGNVIGSSGSVVPLFVEQIAAGGPVTVTHPDVTRYFIRTSEAISLVLQAATLGGSGDIFMLDMGEPVKIVDLARDVIRLSNQSEHDIPVLFTGLRPGEKLNEEIRLEGESIKPTVHPEIVITNAPQLSPEALAGHLTRLQHACSHEREAVIEALRQLVPEYEPSNHSEQEETESLPVRAPALLAR